MIDPTRIIMDARFLRSSVFFSLAELMFVLQFPTLSDAAKCLWLFIAGHSAKNSDLSCALSVEEMVKELGRSSEVIRECLAQLQRMGFLLVSEDLAQGVGTFTPDELQECETYTLTLPNAGLLKLKTAILAELPSRRLFSKEDTSVLKWHAEVGTA